MKKYLLIIALIILSMSVIISCDNTNKSPTTEEKPTTTSEIVILDFSEVSNSRGLTKFPDTGNPFGTVEGHEKTKPELVNMPDSTDYGLWMSCNVMRSLPIFPGLKSANASADAYVNSIKNKELKGYGFHIKVFKAEKTSDGVYIVYNILEGDKVNGRIEYYYSTVEKKFSYREIVAPLFGELRAGDQIFVFELFNVPVDKTQDGYSFKAGELYENGSSFRHISFIDSYSFGEPIHTKINKMIIEDAKLLMNYNNNAVTSMEYEKYSSNIPSEDDNLPGIPIDTITGEVGSAIDISKRDKALQLDGQVAFLKKVFKEKSFAFNGYNSLSEFNNSSLEYLARKQDILDEYTNYLDKKFNGIGFPLSYDLNRNIGACLYNNNGTVKKSNFDEKIPTINSGNQTMVKPVTISEFKGDDEFQFISNPKVEMDNPGFSFPPFVLDQFKKCFGISKEIKTFDQFVSLMFKNLGLSEYADSPELRKSLLRDSYNNT